MQRDFAQSVRGWIGLFLFLLIGAAWIGSAQSVKDEINDVGALRAEVRRLALELLECRAELVQWKVHVINAEVVQVQAERQRLTGERQLIEREIGDLNPVPTSGSGAEDEDRREELNTVHLPTLLENERAVIKREETLTAALGAENARMTEIQKQAQRLAGQSTSPR
jgi:hypothetical protein